MAFLACHYRFEGRECPKNFRFEYFELTYERPSGGGKLQKRFRGPDPVKAHDKFRQFHAKVLPEQMVSYSSGYDHMLMDPSGYEQIVNGDGVKVLCKSVTRLRKVPKGAHLFTVVGGFSTEKGVEFRTDDRGKVIFKEGQVSGTLFPNVKVSAASLYRLRPLCDDELRHTGLVIGWAIAVADTGSTFAETLVRAKMTDYAEERLVFWNASLIALERMDYDAQETSRQ